MTTVLIFFFRAFSEQAEAAVVHRAEGRLIAEPRTEGLLEVLPRATGTLDILN
jgi:hypothetical protein